LGRATAQQGPHAGLIARAEAGGRLIQQFCKGR
jgi:hypothetical protein